MRRRVVRCGLPGLLGGLLLVMGAADADAVQPTPVGPEFQVNTSTGFFPAVAADATGNFVVVWQSSGQDGNLEGIFARRYDSAGVPQGPEFQVNTYTTGNQYFQSVAADATGDFVVVWTSCCGQDGSASGVFAQRYDSAGVPQGSEFQVNTYTTGFQLVRSVASDAAGDVVIVWDSDEGANGPGIFARRYDSAGVPQGLEFQVNTYTTGNQIGAAVAADAAGNFLVAWHSFPLDYSALAILAQRFDSAGVPQGPEFQVNSHTLGYQSWPSAAADAAGNFVVTWTNYGIFARRYDGTGTAEGPEFQVATSPYRQYGGRIAADSAGDFLVTWSALGGRFARGGIFAKKFDSAGVGQGSEFQVNTNTAFLLTAPAVAADAAGDFVVVWKSLLGISGQRYSAVPPPSQTVLGKSCQIGDAGGRRRIFCQAVERATDDTVVGNPIMGGATLRIVAQGTTASDETFVLPEGSSWNPIGTIGYRYEDPDGVNGPVRMVRIKRTPSALFHVKALIQATTGVGVVPPNPGTDVTMALTIGGGAQYCVGFGTGHGGGSIVRNDATSFRVVNPTAEGGCP